MALRYSSAPLDSAGRDPGKSWLREISENRVVRAAAIVAIYSVAFFPMSALPGNAAQFVSIVPVAMIGALLGVRQGLIVAGLFVPLLVILTALVQREPWTYMLYEGRPVALISLVALAAVAGRASDLSRRLTFQRGLTESHIRRIESLAKNRSRLIELGMTLADAHSTTEVHRAVCSMVSEWISLDRIACVELDTARDSVEIKYAQGTDIPGFGVGQRFDIDPSWKDEIEHDRESSRQPERTLPYDKLQKWKDAGFQSVLRVPLVMEEGLTGYLALSSFEPNAFSEADEELILAAGQQITPHLRAAALFDEQQQEAKLRDAQAEILRSMSMNNGMEILGEVADREMRKLIDFDLCMIAEVSQGKDQLTVTHAFGERKDLVREGTSFDWDPDFMHLDDEVRYWDLDALQVGDGAYPFSMIAAEGFRSVGMITLLAEGEPIGWMVIAGTKGSLENSVTTRLMQSIGAYVAGAMVRCRAQEEQKTLLSTLEKQNTELQAAREHLSESQKEVEKQNKELQRANEAKNTFLSAVSHELKTPLAIMVGFAELLGMNISGNLTDQQLEQLRMVERNGRHLDLLVSDLVDVSRIESGRLAVNLEPTLPAEVLDETLQGLDSISAEKEQVLVRDYDLGETVVRADRARLGQVVTNLVTNACKYSPEKTDVRISARIDGHELEVSVSDSGIGISKEDQEKLFTPFFRSTNEDAHREKGTGLGLVITRSIVEMHGGTLELDSDLGKGTTITVRMPGVVQPDSSGTASIELAGPQANGQDPDKRDAA